MGVEKFGDAGPNDTPTTVVNEQQTAPVPASPQNESEFLQGLSPPSSGFARKESPVALTSENDPPLGVVSGTVAQATGAVQPAVLPAMELEIVGGVLTRAGSGVAEVPLVAPSDGWQHTGGGGELVEGDEGGGSARAKRRSVEQILQPGDSQVSSYSENWSTVVVVVDDVDDC